MLSEYYGIDWLAMILTFSAIYFIGNRNRIGLILMMVGNICWATVGFQAESTAMILANAAFLMMNIRAVYKWSSPDTEGA
ncbi:nicotinamide mononucleotide transporter [Thiolapillus brandeum]